MNDYAARVAPYLVAAFPDHAAVTAVDEEGELHLEIPCPSDSVDAGLSVFTWNWDVIVAFHRNHAHFSDWHRTGTDEHIHEAMEAAHEVLTERLVAVEWYSRRGLLAGSFYTPENALATLHRSQQAALRRSQTIRARIRRRLGLPPPRLPRRLWPKVPRSRETLHQWNWSNYDRARVTLRSWNGTYDADSEPDVFLPDNER